MLPAIGGFTPAGSGVDAALVARIRRAYRAAMTGWRGAGDSMWAEIGQRNAPVHAALLAEDARLAEVLRDPGRFDLLYGFHSLFAERTDALHAADDTARQSVADALAAELWRLCEAVGARWLRNPEATGQAGQDADVEAMLDGLDQALRIRIDFPNPWLDEFGLVTSRGVASYRAIHALYQAHRLRAMAGPSGRVLEIGAGLGRTAYYARRMGLTDYTIVDLPMTNVAQAGFLGTVLGGQAVTLSGEAAGGRIRILSPEWLHRSGEAFDVVLNVDAMTEMDRGYAEEYAAFIRDHAGVFISINHEANRFRLRDLEGLRGMAVERYPYWMRAGYTEEVFRAG